MAKVCHWYSWPPLMVDEMSREDFEVYYQAMEIMESQSLMSAMKASQYPHMAKQEDKEELHKYVHKHAYPESYEQHRLDRMEALKFLGK